MPNLENLELIFDADAVLRGQGADPLVLRQRRPALARLADQALEEGFPLLEPYVLYKEFDVQALRHEKMIFEQGGQLSGKLISQHLTQAKKVYVILCTVGESIDQYAAEMWNESSTYSLALDGVGSAAVEALANAACHRFEIQEQQRGWQTSIPLSPGMIDWPVVEGQPQIFDLLRDESPPVELNSSYIMIPRKSLTMVLAAGPVIIHNNPSNQMAGHPMIG